MRDWAEVHHLYHDEGRSRREIAQLTGMSRNTVSRLLALPEPPRYNTANRPSLLTPFQDAIDGFLRDHPAMPATEMHRRLAALGYGGGISILRAHLRERRSGTPARKSRAAHQPGKPWATDVLPVSFDPQAPPLDALEGTELGMNLISADFEIQVVNRANERLFQKPASATIGRKCYEEFERRDHICPHCPGLKTLHTGLPHSVETRGIRDDGTGYAVRITTYPVTSPAGETLGFVEVEENITDRKRSETVVELLREFHHSVPLTDDVPGALRQALNAGFLLEGVDYGYVYHWRPGLGDFELIARRGAHRQQRTSGDGRGDPAVPSPWPSGASALVPISVGGQVLAKLLFGSNTLPEFPRDTRAAIETLGQIVANAITGHQARQRLRRAQSDLESLLNTLPLPGWCLDERGTVTLWNHAAESLMGWTGKETVGRQANFIILVDESSAGDGRLHPRDADDVRLELQTRSGTILSACCRRLRMREDLRGARQTLIAHSWIVLEERTARQPKPDKTPAVIAPSQREDRCRSFLLIRSPEADHASLVEILSSLGHSVILCDSVTEAVERYASHPEQFDAVIAELLEGHERGAVAAWGGFRKAGHRPRILLTAEAPVRGFRELGFAGLICRPYQAQAVAETVTATTAPDAWASALLPGIER